jgi:sporulation protein YlmC with PRC-barrel domain
MRSTIISAVLLSTVALSTGAIAASAGDIKTGQFVNTSDGKRVGRVYDFDKAKDGSVTGITVIRDNRIIHIASSTLTSSDKGVTTSLTYDDIKKIK